MVNRQFPHYSNYSLNSIFQNWLKLQERSPVVLL
jgi:hypothetical protein